MLFMKKSLKFIALFLFLGVQLKADVKVLFETNLGSFTATLFSDVAPVTVNNFLNYVNRGDYDNSFMHRLIPGFVIQGGGFRITEQEEVENIPTDGSIINEFNLSNLAGTLAMAKLGGDPNSATSQWFINLADNSANLDFQNGGFTVFGKVDDLSVIEGIVSVPSIVDASGSNSAFGNLPVINYNGGGTIPLSSLVTIESISIVPEFAHYSLFLGIFFIGYLVKRTR